MELIDKPTSEFICEHRTDDVRKLAFAADKYPSVDFPLALDQIQGWQMARKKLPSWASVDGMVYPPHINMEQCSSEFTAKYKSSLFHLQGRALCPTALTPAATNSDADCNPNGAGRQSNGAAVHKALPCNLLIDLTGGFGVDFSFMSRSFSHAIYVERNPNLCTIAQHNFSLLGLNNVEVINSDSVAFLKEAISNNQAVVSNNQNVISKHLKARLTSPFSPPLEGPGEAPDGYGKAPDGPISIFLDPARRDSYGRKMASISDCEPDVIALLPQLAKLADVLILKLSPMLDWHEAVKEINGEYFSVTSVHIVSVKNECKELLLVARNVAVAQSSKSSEQEPSLVPQLYCVNDEQRFSCSLSDAGSQQAPFCPQPGSLSSVAFDVAKRRPTQRANEEGLAKGAFLYVPNSSIMKAGCFSAVASWFGLQLVAPNSHLFVSSHSIDEFPGRQFQILAVSSMNKRELRANMAGIKHANISVRNFPMSVEALRKRLKVTDGGDVYIFATTVADGSHVLIITKKAE